MTALLIGLCAIHAALMILLVWLGLTNTRTNLALVVIWAALELATALTLARMVSWAS